MRDPLFPFVSPKPTGQVVEDVEDILKVAGTLEWDMDDYWVRAYCQYDNISVIFSSLDRDEQKYGITVDISGQRFGFLTTYRNRPSEEEQIDDFDESCWWIDSGPTDVRFLYSGKSVSVGSPITNRMKLNTVGEKLACFAVLMSAASNFDTLGLRKSKKVCFTDNFIKEHPIVQELL